MKTSRIQAVIFDLGGVVLESPLPAIAAFESDHALPPRFIARLVVEGGGDGPWARLERGELDAAAFTGAFSAQGAAAGHAFDAAALLARIEDAVVPRPAMVHALGRLRAAGYRVAALTNAWDMPDRAGRIDPLRAAFDCFVESFRVGMRKPERRIYELACRELRAPPSEVIFLDDLGSNLKTAQAMGMTTIKVGDPAPAIAELERLTGTPLTGCGAAASTAPETGSPAPA